MKANDQRLCPGCGRLGEPETFRNGVYKMLCKHPDDCDYEDYWDAEDEDHTEAP